MTNIEFNHPDKGWVESFTPLTWEECEWVNRLTSKEVYREVEA